MTGDTGNPQSRGAIPPYIASAIVSAIVLVLFAPGLFVAGYFTNALVDDDNAGSTPPVQPTAAPTAEVQATPTPPIVVANVSADDDPSWGPDDATVTIVEFSDFQCPYCARFALDTYPQIKQQYEGKVKFVYRDYPLTAIHQYAEKAAEAAGCASNQDKYWEYFDLLWTKQDALDEESLKSYAADLGLDTDAFNGCLDSGTYVDEIQNDIQEGRSYGVEGTPAFFVNGQFISGALPFADFKTVIDAALEGKLPSSAVPDAAAGSG